ncbi:MAG TPA: primosomal protein N' [Nocardioidaceae bacterium]|nr:primosomal protein N' [Nocardioidaceae bacterium]
MAEDEREEDGQLALLPELARARARQAKKAAEQKGRERPKRTVERAPERPVARVLVDVPLAHLDRPFDYLVPATMHEQVTDGCRVRVRFAGQLVDGYVLERVEESEHAGRLAPLARAVSPEPVLAPEIARLSGTLAARYAGTRSDVLRLAVPKRHATTEKRPSRPAMPATEQTEGGQAWDAYRDGAAYLRSLADGGIPRAVWTALPGPTWPEALAQAAAAAERSGRGALLCVPDRRDVDPVDAALTEVLGPDRHVVLTADLGPAARYRAFLAVRRGAVRVVVGTRAAAFAPVHNLGLVAIWDDGDDLFAEPRAPYPHTREVLLLRAEEQHCAALIGGFARTVESEYLLDTGWARPLAPDRALLRERAPRVVITGATDRELERDPGARMARLPRSAYDAIRDGLEHGPVLLQTPRRGYVSSLACDRCRTPARCTACTGPLWLPTAHTPPTCRWCATERPAWACPVCGGHGLRAPALGEGRTAEEIGRAFPGAPVRSSAGERVLDRVGPESALVVATPGAEPVAEGGYACVALLDTWLMLARPDLRVGEESLRRWLNAAALARPASQGGRVIAVGDPATPSLQALVRWDPGGFTRREMAERRSAHLPPASRLVTVTGADADVEQALGGLRLPAAAEVLGPGPVPARGAETAGQARVVVRVPRAHGSALSEALREMQALRAARKLAPVRVHVDPVGLE